MDESVHGKLCALRLLREAMLHQIIHTATITLQLPYATQAHAEVAALRAAGIPVDDLGNARSGYLFVRTTGRGPQRTNTFRWFATGIGESLAAIGASPPPPQCSEAQAASH